MERGSNSEGGHVDRLRKSNYTLSQVERISGKCHLLDMLLKILT